MKTSSLLPLALMLCALSTLTACSKFTKPLGLGDQANTYRSAQATPILEVPDDLKNTTIGNETETLPDNVTPKALTDVPLPPGSLTQQIQSGEVSKKVLDQKLPDPK